MAPEHKIDCSKAAIRYDIHEPCLKKVSSTTSVKSKCGKFRSRSFERKRAGPRALDGKEVVDLVTHDLMRELLIPSKETNYYPIKLEKEELERLKKQAVHLTEKERLKLKEDYEKQVVRLAEESAARKNKLREFEIRGGAGPGPKLTALEQEAKDKSNYLLKRAWELRQEQEDEVKSANSLILKTKCQAIRDAQLEERKLIAKELALDQKRIEQMVEDERIRGIENENRKLEKVRAFRAQYVHQLDAQMEDIEVRRGIEAGRKSEESRRLKEAMYQVLREELQKIEEREKEKIKTRDDLNKANEQLRRCQEIEREEARQADLRMQEYMRQKAEREEAFEKEQKEIKKQRELETARLRAMQEKAGDLQAIKDEQAAVRRQEDYEREWRRKEREATEKRRKMIEDLVKGRDKQVQDQHRMQAFELQREKREFERVLRAQIEIQEKERLLELKRRHELEKYRTEILKQINEKEKDKIMDRQLKFEEGRAIKLEAAKREMELKATMKKKVEDLRKNKVPDHYIHEIERQLKLKE